MSNSGQGDLSINENWGQNAGKPWVPGSLTTAVAPPAASSAVRSDQFTIDPNSDMGGNEPGWSVGPFCG